MAYKKMAVSSPEANTNTDIYVVPASKTATAVLNICNTNTVEVTVRVAISTTATPDVSEWIEYDTSIPPKGVLERTSLAMETGEHVVISASATGVAFRLSGIEE